MITKKIQNQNEMIFIFEGRLDVESSPELVSEIEQISQDIKCLIFDFENLEYISSAGLRAILAAYRLMQDNGKFIIKNARENIKELFNLTKFSNILTLE